jgi:hypothetical protein
MRRAFVFHVPATMLRGAGAVFHAFGGKIYILL